MVAVVRRFCCSVMPTSGFCRCWLVECKVIGLTFFRVAEDRIGLIDDARIPFVTAQIRVQF